MVEKMSGPWIVEPIELADNQEVFFEPGVVVLANKGAFRGGSDSLFSAWGRKNVTLTGPGATLQMRRADYDAPPYRKAEWRHVLNFHGCTNVTVTGLTLASSGGDGIYLGAGRAGQTNRNVTIRNVICDRNYRQGISVITVDGLVIEDCVLRGTAGTPPAAGIDFEPNSPREQLSNCLMRNCTIENNQGYALHVYAAPLNASSAPIGIRVVNCVTRGSNARSVSIVTRSGPAGPVKGLIEFEDCRFEDTGRAGISIGSKPPEGVRVRFVRCTLADPADKPAPASPIVLSARKGDLGDIGGVEFVDFVLRERIERPLIKLDNAADARVRDLTGTISVERDGRRTVHTLDQKLIDQWFPFDPVTALRPVSWEKLSVDPLWGAARTKGKLSAHRVREEATYLLAAEKGQQVSVRLAHEPVGRYEGKPLAVRVLNPAGKEVQRTSVPLREQAECTFTPAESGIFRIVCQPGQHTVRIVSSTHPVLIAGHEGQIHLLGTTGEFVFWVAPGTKEFGLRVKGEGEGERVSAAVLDSLGKIQWQRLNIGPAQSLHVKRHAAAPGELWRLQLSRPSVAVLEDVYLDFRGIPAVLGFGGGGK